MKIFSLNFILALLHFHSANPLNIFLHDPADSTTISDNDMRRVKQLLISATCFKLFAVAALLLPAPTLIAQTSSERRLEFESFTVNDGLSQNFVTCILQDYQGFLWFGTRDGLNRYDGYQFKVYSFDAEDTTSISANTIQSLYEDKGGNLWVGTWFGGLNKYDRARDRFVRYSYQQEAPTQNLTFPIQEDQSGILWLGTADGLKRFDPQTGRFTSFFYKPDDSQRWKYNSVFAILEADDGNLWLGTPQEFSGLLYFNRTTETFTPFKVDPKNFIPGRPLIIRAICRDQSGNLWVGDAAGLFRINEQWLLDQLANPSRNEQPDSQGEFAKVADLFTEVISALCQDEAGDLWIGSPNGLFIYDIDPRLPSPKPAMENRGVTHILSNTGVTAIYKDRSGLMWLGTNGNGIYKLRSARQGFGRLAHNPEAANSLSNRSIRAICETGDSTLWIGGYSGLDKLDRKSGRITHYFGRMAGYGGEAIWAIYEDPLHVGRILWIGAEGSLYRFDRSREKFTRYQNTPGNPQSLNDNFVLSVYRDSSGTLWVGTNSGLNRFDDRTEKFTQYNQDPTNPHGLRGGFILSILESGRVLWLATTNGLSCFDPATEQFTHFLNEPRNPRSLSHNEILCLKQDRRGRIWIGTAGGLNQLILDKNPTENRLDVSSPTRLDATFVHYAQKHGLPSNVINGILEDETGKLWLSTNKGLAQFDPEAKTFRNFDASDGLQSNEFNRAAYFQCRHGEMFFGGVNGINMFFSQAAKDNPHLPPVVLTAFKLFNKPVGLATHDETPLKKVIAETEEIRLSHEDNVFSFEFAALEFTAPERNQYAYKMEGFDKDWINLGTKREAVYTNLAPGKYTFRVKASNNDGVWNETGASVKITITPPWWRTWWAYALYGVIFFGTLYGLWRYEMNRQQFKNRMELKHVETEKLQELDRLKSRFFANISHEFRTPMTLIIGPLEQMLAEEPQPGWKKFIPMMHRHANRLLRLINQLLDLAKLESGGAKLAPTQGDFVAFLKGLTMSFDSLAVHKRIALKFAAQPAALPSYFDRDKIEKIFSNLLANAFKFTPEGGEISVQVSVTSDQLSVASNQLSVNQSIIDHCLLITVRDTGIGISPTHLPHIFDRFYQADTSASSVREHEGAGIGLALVKELVELHHGDISVKSEEGKGTEFIVRLFLPVISDQFSVTNCQ